MEMPHQRAMGYWQDFTVMPPPQAVWPDAYAAPMPDGRALMLPLRDLGETAVAGLIANQASFLVLDQLAAWLGESVARFEPEVVFGLPTLGHAVAPVLARALGHSNWVPAGFSRKLWYDEALSVPAASITSPMAGRRMWLDPRTIPQLMGRRVLLVDDVMSTGRSMSAGLTLLRAADIQPVAAAVLMIQTDRWQAAWDASVPVSGAFATPLFVRSPDGWTALEDAQG
jgi:adenine/guanine phosphoribosyltransferase-like PRPP-binding protein